MDFLPALPTGRQAAGRDLTLRFLIYLVMFNFLSRFLGKPNAYLGVDIGTTSIKVVELSGSKNNATLSNYALLESFGHFERANNVIQANAVKISEKETTALLKILLKKMKFKTQLAVASIPSFASFVTLIELPSMSVEETNKTMAFQIRQNIPLPLTEIAVDWIRVGQRQDENGFEKQQILLVAIPNETIARYKSVSLRALEIENLAYARSTVGGDPTPTLVADIGARSTSVSIIEEGFLKSSVQFDYAGDSLTQAIVKGLGIGYRRAEELKKQRGIMGGVGEYELSTLEIPFVDVIIDGVVKAKTGFESSFSSSIQRILLVGGGAQLLGLDKYFENKVGIPVVLGNGLLFINAPSQTNVVARELQTRFATAIGLAIKGFL